jgi:hypothetical protein
MQRIDRLVGQERQADRRGARLADLEPHEPFGGRGGYRRRRLATRATRPASRVSR